MIRMFTTTYGESVISTPIWAIGEPRGPMLNGMTYMVRPAMHPSNKAVRVSFISLGLTQLLVGPASDLLWQQINVRSSTRATSLGSERERKLLGRFASLRRMKVPLSTISVQSRSFSSSEPSQMYTRSGLQSTAISLIHLRSSVLLVRAPLVTTLSI